MLERTWHIEEGTGRKFWGPTSLAITVLIPAGAQQEGSRRYHRGGLSCAVWYVCVRSPVILTAPTVKYFTQVPASEVHDGRFMGSPGGEAPRYL